ncbi:5'/3'-nucleotidase SurE [Antarcticimicrobium luteum]|uniref:5'-nucleotidase SurE n=1 Tax=Antarcticimicrobium luteum TaxID=2547397 RepID=A0A4R5V1N9_9RHOB|nr:5'/3'-nucleotidase SurE [Antarcticimicrobium luteum]TDK45710.1 5'/3'-nucleotidase SurE [Antarcticimicrobium luteum]
MDSLKNHRVLLVNDDGIDADGIKLLERVVGPHSKETWVVAPAEEMSGASHSISMHLPIRHRQIDRYHHAVKGTPTDCALMGIYEIMPEPPSLLLSGMNWGANLAEDLTYSGTASAAMEGALLGVPSVAMSLVHAFEDVHWATAEKFAPEVLDGILSAGIAPGTFVNVNFPPVPPDEVKGIRICRLGQRPPGSFKPTKRSDARRKDYWWIQIMRVEHEIATGTDLEAIENNEIAITPIKLDMTAEQSLRSLEQAFGS